MPYQVSGDPEGVGSVHLQVNGQRMEMTFISKDGNVYDYFSIQKQLGTVPVVNITYPLDGAVYETLQTIEIIADATDPDGQIAQVEFFVEDVSIGTDLTYPYKVNWTPVIENYYNIYVTATDDDGNLVRSSSFSIRMGTPAIGTIEVAVNGSNDDAEENLHKEEEKSTKEEGVEVHEVLPDYVDEGRDLYAHLAQEAKSPDSRMSASPSAGL